MISPLVSVVVPTHNRPELLKRALESVREQVFADYEVIVIDDGESPRVKDIVLSFHDDRFQYIAHEPANRGGAASRNTGIKNARADFIAFLDDDDEWLPEKLEVQMNQLKDTPPEVGFCISGVITRSPAGEAKNLPRLLGIADMSELALTRFAGFMTTALIVKKGVFNRVGGFDESFPSHQETELMIRITRIYKGLGIADTLAVMDLSPHEHIGGDPKRRITGREMLLKKHLMLYADLPRVLARHYFQIGLWCRDSGQIEKAKSYFWKAFKLSKNPRYFAHWLLVFYRKDFVCQ